MKIIILLAIFLAVCAFEALGEVEKRTMGFGFNRNMLLYKRMLEKRLIDPMTFGSGFANLR
uniref:Secreted peptide prohormone 8 n=1 Tax=Schmidtea mediterranea TaxID=79327 RepID=E3T7U3_SCHMD|nr:secreted peptide prohormone 8 [Schmidtea mediterranea]